MHDLEENLVIWLSKLGRDCMLRDFRLIEICNKLCKSTHKHGCRKWLRVCIDWDKATKADVDNWFLVCLGCQ